MNTAEMNDDAVALLAGARRLAPLVERHRGQFDNDRQLPLEIVDGLHAGGLFRMWVPRALGGFELDPLNFLRVIEELSRLDGSVGWCAVIPAGYARLAGALREDVARRIFTGAGRGILVGTLNPTGKAIVTDGGYRVTGKWGYGSFIAYGEWVLGNCVIEDASGPRRAGGAPEFRLCLFPIGRTEIVDMWHVGGLRATGSNDYSVSDLFVPEEHTIPLVDFQPPSHRSGPLYAVPMTSTFVSCIATVTLGIARAAIEALTEIAETKTTAGSTIALRDKPLAQADLARAEALVGAGRAYLWSELGAMWDSVVKGNATRLEDRAKVRLAAVHATQCAIQAVDIIYKLGGGASLLQSGRLERCSRDVHAAGQHVAVSPLSNFEPVGRVLFGLPPGMARF